MLRGHLSTRTYIYAPVVGGDLLTESLSSLASLMAMQSHCRHVVTRKQRGGLEPLSGPSSQAHCRLHLVKPVTIHSTTESSRALKL